MKRWITLAIAIAFIAGLTFLTVRDVVNNSVTPIDVVSFLIIAFLAVALIGALTARAEK